MQNYPRICDHKEMLDDFTVVDFTHVLAGQNHPKMLAEHSAEALKIEPIGSEMIRIFPSLREGRSARFVQHNVGKKTWLSILRQLKVRKFVMS